MTDARTYPRSYWIASLHGQDVAAIAPAKMTLWHGTRTSRSMTLTRLLIASSGDAIVAEPQDAGPGGRTATCNDPAGARFRLWQARRRLGAQLVNALARHVHGCRLRRASRDYGAHRGGKLR